MEPTITDLNVTKTLLNTATFGDKDHTTVTIKKLILRPILKRIVFVTEEFQRIIIFEGDADYNVHQADSTDILIAELLTKIDSLYKK